MLRVDEDDADQRRGKDKITYHCERIEHEFIRIRDPKQSVEQLDNRVAGRDFCSAIPAAPAQEYVAEQREQIVPAQRVAAVGAERAPSDRADAARDAVD